MEETVWYSPKLDMLALIRPALDGRWFVVLTDDPENHAGTVLASKHPEMTGFVRIGTL